MKTHYSFIKGCCLLAAFLLAIPLTGLATTSSRLFKPRHQTSLVRSLNAQLTHSDTIPLQNMSAVYALSIDVTITQPREASFVRIVLEDAGGHDYLVAESDRFRNDTATVQLTEYCEETARLDGITPVCLKCYLAGDATLTVTGIHTSDQMPTRGATNSMETAAAIKEAQVQDIVDRINEYNARHGKLWRAGLNNWALADYDSDIKGEGDAYTANFKYYTDGIYEMGERPAQRTTYVSPYVEAFDWRDRHGKNWIGDSIRNQGNTQYCMTFAFVGATEAMTNLYFNDTLYYDLSEQYIISTIAPNTYGSTMIVTRLQNPGVIDEVSCPYLGGYYPNVNLIGNDTISIGTVYQISSNQPYDSITSQIKHHLINNGPCVWGFNLFPLYETIYNTRVYAHHMSLVGYGKVTANDYYSIVGENTYLANSFIQSGHNAIGYTYWIFKDSYGNYSKTQYHHNGYRYVIFYDTSKMGTAYYMQPQITSSNMTDDDIVIEDHDGDGYFNWGIGSRPNNRLPAWAEQEEDGDDNNSNKGPMTTFGILSDISYPTTITINQDMTDSLFVEYEDLSKFIRCNIRLATGVTFTIKGNLAFYAGKNIYMNNNSTLIIDGGTLVDPTLYKSGTGCAVKIMNGGKIQCHKKSEFVLPNGISLEMDDGSVY